MGWDLHCRKQAAERFELDYTQMGERHHLTLDTYEGGKLSLKHSYESTRKRLAEWGLR
jgi:putative hydrolase of the HAD superfamily